MPVHVVEYSTVFAKAEKVYKDLMGRIPYERDGGVLFLYGKEDLLEESGFSKACMSFSIKEGYNVAWQNIHWYHYIGQKFNALMHHKCATAYEGSVQGLCPPGGFATEGKGKQIFAAHGLGWQLEEILCIEVMYAFAAITKADADMLLTLSKNTYAHYCVL